ncbi:MAG: rRNA pseudouridine synthase, partial [Clostridia bacterium]|nr:rRNA pseudouridine synthase [Clostridia bacterium]
MRLDKLIASQGKYSRNDVKKLIRDGLVTVDGEKAATSDIQVNPETSEVVVDGTPLCYREHVYIMLTKPAGVVSATDDREHETVLDLVPDGLKRPGLFPAGRL